ncbi:hypothetical protein BH11BAC5_BH11BAC5_09440 [soil metagenome]
MNNAKKILTAIAAGAAAGLILGVLFAPDKGTETRRKMKKQKEKFTDELKDKLQKGKDRFSGYRDTVEQKIRKVADEFAQESV